MPSTTGTVASFISAAPSLSSDSYVISDTATAIVGNLNTIVANQSKVHQLNIILSNDDTVAGNLRSDATIVYYALNTYSGSVNLALNNNLCTGGGVYESGLDMLNQLLTTYTNWTVTPFAWNPGALAVDVYKYADMNSKLITAMSLASGLSTVSVQSGTYSAYNIVHYYGSSFYQKFGNAFAPLNGTLRDSANNIQTNLDALSASPFLPTTVSFTDSTLPLITVTQAQLTSDTKVISSFSGNFNLNVTSVSVQNLVSVLHTAKVTSVQISDTAADIQADLLSLSSVLNANVGAISAIKITDSAVVKVTPSVAGSDAQVLALILSGGGNYQVTQSTVSQSGSVSAFLTNASAAQNASFSVVDSASNISSNIDQLQSNYSKIAKVIISDGQSVVVSTTQAVSDAQVLNQITSNGGKYTVAQQGISGNVSSFLIGLPLISTYTITDSISNILGNLDTLNSNASKITSINLSDTGSINISAAQYTSDASVLGKITNAYGLAVSGVSAGNVSGLAANSHLSAMTVSDSANNLALNLDKLQTNLSKISSITVADHNALILSQNQVTSDSQALSLITANGGSYIVSQNPTSWSVSGFLSAVASLGSNKLAITDSVSNIGANLDVLQANIGKISALTVTGTGAINVSLARSVADTALLSLFTAGGGTFNIIKSSASGTVANFLSGLANSSGNSFAIVDSAANISASIDAIQSNLSKVSSILSNDGLSCTVSQAQAANDAQALSILIASGGSYQAAQYASTGPVSSFLSFVNGLPTSAFSLVDTASNIAASMDLLQTNSAKLVSVMVSDSAPIVITAQQFINDSAVVNLLTGKYSLNVSGLNATNALTILHSQKVSNAIITDTSANIAGVLDGLQADIAQIKSIVISDATPLTVTQVQSVADSQILSMIKNGGGTFKVLASPNNGGVANFLSQLQVLQPSSYSLLDSSSNISNNFDILKANASKLNGIYATDGQPIALTGAQFHVSQGGLSLLSPSTTLKVSSIAASDINVALNNPNLVSMSVSDTAQNIGLYLDRIQLGTNKISGLVVSDGKPLNLTQAQVTADPQAVSLLSSSGVSIQTVPNTVTVPSNGYYSALPNQSINGIKGLSTVSFAGPSNNFSLSMIGTSGTLIDNSGLYGKISLNNVQRLAFSDGSQLALDLQPNQNSFNALIAAGTVFGAASAQKNFAYFVSMFDQGNSVSNVSQQIANSGLIESTLGISTANTYSNDKMWVDYVYQNVVGTNPGFASEQYYVNFLTTGNLSKYDLLNIAINFANDPNGYVAAHANLVGLQHQGLPFMPAPVHA